MHDVAIIGAGLSGLSAAALLNSHDVDVVVLEKSRGLSGRAATRRVDLPGGHFLPVDHGAQFFTARDSSFLQKVQEWLSRGVCFEWTNGFHTWDGCSLLSPDKARESPRYACFQGMSALGNDLGTGLDVRRNYRVGSVFQQKGGWRLFPTDSEEEIGAKTIFCSIPIPQALGLLQNHLVESEFHFLKSIEYGRCLALIAFYEEQRDRPKWKGIQVRDPQSSLSWMAWDSSKRNGGNYPLSIVLHATPAFSSRDEITSEKGKEKALKEMLRDAALIGGEWIGHPSTTIAHLWHYAIPLTDGINNGFLRSAKNHGLYFIGDGLSGGRVEGAWISGHRAAHDYISCLNEKTL